ncbi:MAG: hypothetical protein LBM60_06475, partial [Clostridium sp.]|nr:hypothetical protein [Clostridium sp.]
MSRQEGEKKTVKYKRPLNLNIGMLIFLFILIYLIVTIVTFLRKDPIRGYEVMEGSLSNNTVYRGIALRSETLIPIEEAGYVNYLIREGERVAKGDVVYVTDGSGKLRDLLADGSDASASGVFENEDLLEFRADVIAYMDAFDPVSFQGVYEFKDSLAGMVSTVSGIRMLETVDATTSNTRLRDAAVTYAYAPQTGLVAYWVDGYESMTPEQMTNAMWEQEDYERTNTSQEQLIAQGEPAYKLATDEHWSVMIPMEPTQDEALADGEFIKVRFLKNQYESWAEIKHHRNGVDEFFIELLFTNSMVTFLSERFVDVELILQEETGLKIPVSAIATVDFFLVPEAYLTKAGANGADGVMRQTYLEDGTPSVEFLETDINYRDDETKECYLDVGVLMAGDVLTRPDSQETYTVSKRATLTGVYNM